MEDPELRAVKLNLTTINQFQQETEEVIDRVSMIAQNHCPLTPSLMIHTNLLQEFTKHILDLMTEPYEIFYKMSCSFKVC